MVLSLIPVYSAPASAAEPDVRSISSEADITAAISALKSSPTQVWNIQNNITISKRIYINENQAHLTINGGGHSIIGGAGEFEGDTTKSLLWMNMTGEGSTLQISDLTFVTSARFRHGIVLDKGRTNATLTNVTIDQTISYDQKDNAPLIVNYGAQVTIDGSFKVITGAHSYCAIDVSGKNRESIIYNSKLSFAEGASVSFVDGRTEAMKTAKPLINLDPETGSTSTVEGFEAFNLKYAPAAESSREKDGYDLKAVKIGENSFYSIANALATVTDGTPTVLVLQNDCREDVAIPEGRNITLDLNGYVLQGSGSGSVITNNGTLTIEDSRPNTEHRFSTVSDLWEADDKGSLIVKGGVITGGTGTVLPGSAGFTCGGGVYNNGALNMTGGNIVGNTALFGGGVYVKSNTFTMSGGSIIGNMAKSTVSDRSSGGGVQVAQGATLTVDGSKASISYNRAAFGGAVWVGGVCNFYAGMMSGNKAAYETNDSTGCGGGVYISENGALTMGAEGKNPIISKNSANDGGGGVDVFDQFTMFSGEISENNSKASGAGVYLHGDSGKNTANPDKTFVMYGGSIKNNVAQTKGGGVYVDNYDITMEMLGGEITGNTAAVFGGGIAVSQPITVGGAAKVTGNTVNGKNNNVYLRVDKKSNYGPIIKLKPLTDEASVGVSLDKTPVVGDTISIVEATITDVSGCFFTDDESLGLVDSVVSSVHTLKLAAAPVFVDGFGGAVTKENYAAWTHGDYTLAGWYDNAAFTGSALSGDPAYDTTYYAKWTRNGKTVIATPLNFFEGADITTYAVGNSTDTGVEWNNGTKTLTLSGAAIEATGNSEWGVRLPAGTKLVVKDGTVNSIINGNPANPDQPTYICAVQVLGDLEISGSGKLTAEVRTAGDNFVEAGIETYGNLVMSQTDLTATAKNLPIFVNNEQPRTLTIQSGKITANAGISYIDDYKYAISTHKGDIIIEGGEVTTNGGSHGIVAGMKATEKGALTISGGTIRVETANAGLWAYDDVTISGGTVYAKATGTDTGDYGIYSFAGNIILSGAETVITAVSESSTTGNQFGVNAKNGDIRIASDTELTAVGSTAAFNVGTGKSVKAPGASYVMTSTNLDGRGATPTALDAGTGLVSLNGNPRYAKIYYEYPQATPTCFAADESISGKADGAISGLDDTMEYKLSTAAGYTKVPAGTATLSDLEDGTYLVRYAAKRKFSASPDQVLTVSAGRTLTVRFDSVGGSTVASETDLQWQDKAAKPADPTRLNSEFKGWYLNGSLYDFNTAVTEDLCLEARWLLQQTAEAVETVVPTEYDLNSTTTKVQVTGDTGAQGSGLESVAAVIKSENSTENVKVLLTIEKTTAYEAPSAQVSAIREKTGSKTVELLDVSLVMKVGTATDAAITNTNGKVIEIVIPFNRSGKQNIAVYRYHEGEGVKTFIEAQTGADGTFYTTDEAVHLFTTKFSTYAIGYTVPDSGVVIGSISGVSSYAVTVKAAEHGSVKASAEKAAAGKTVILTVKADEGWKLQSLSAKNSAGAELALTTVTEGESYSFVMPSGKVTVSAVFEEVKKECKRDASCVYAKFTDASPADWYHDGIHFCVENGYMNGTSDTMFEPNGTLSRAMIVTMLWRSEGSPVVNYLMNFEDVAAEGWYTEAVRWAASEGIVKGYDDGSFKPMKEITREELAVMFYRIAEKKGQGFTGASMFYFNPVDREDISDWASEAMRWCYMHKIISGYESGALKPGAKATRAEAATMLMRFLNTLSE